MRWPLWRTVVAGVSMAPALLPGDQLLLVRPVRAGRPVRVRTGQIVVARQPGAEHRLLVKRVIAADPDGWWLDSDNSRAPGAADSWRFGAVPPGLIEGRLLLRYWPPRRGSGRASGGDGADDRPRPKRDT